MGEDCVSRKRAEGLHGQATRSRMQSRSSPEPANGFNLLPTQLPPIRLTTHAGFVQWGGRIQGWVDLGPIGEQELHTLDAARGTGIAERGAAVDVPGIHLVGRKKQMSRGRVENSLAPLNVPSSWQRHFLAFFETFLGSLVRAKAPC